MNIETEVRAYIAKNLLFSEDGFPYPDDASFLREGIIDSLGVMELVTFATAHFSIQIDPQEVTPENFDSVEKLAAYVRRKKAGSIRMAEPATAANTIPLKALPMPRTATPLIEIQPTGTRTPLIFLHGDILGGGFYCFNLARQLGPDQPFYSLPPLPLAGDRIPSVEEIAAEQLRTLRAHTPHGPYLLGGFCIGAFVALEIAQRLRAEGEIVEQLVIVDPQLPSFLGWLRRLIEFVSALRRDSMEDRLAKFMSGYRRWYRICELWHGSLADKLRFVTRRPARGSVEKNPVRPVRLADAPLSTRRNHDLTAAYPWCAAKYRPRSYGGRATLFCCDNVMMSAKRKLRAWRRLVPNATLHLMPGEHLDLVTSNADKLATHLRAALDDMVNATQMEDAVVNGSICLGGSISAARAETIAAAPEETSPAAASRAANAKGSLALRDAAIL